MKSNPKTARIYLYPGLSKGEPHYLTSVGTVEDLKKWRVSLSEGLTLTFYDHDATDRRDDDKLLFEGTVHFDDQRKAWYAFIDWKSFRHESDELID